MKKLLVLALLFFSQSVIADFTSASVAYENEDYAQAYTEFKQLAIIGNKRAQYNLAIMHLRGQGVAKDLTDAYAWVKLSQTTERPKYYRTMKRIEERLSVDELKLAEDKANTLQSNYGEGQIYTSLSPILQADMDDKNSEDDYSLEIVKREQPQWPVKLRGVPHRGWVTVEHEVYPDGTVHNLRVVDAYPDDAFNKVVIAAMSKWQFKPSYKDGIAPHPISVTQGFTFLMNRNHDDFKEIYAQRLETIKKLAANDSSRAQYVYAIAANSREYVDDEDRIEQSEINNWLLKSAQNGNVDAQYLLGKNILRGKGCKTEEQKGLFWISQSAKNGNNYATRLTYDLLASGKYKNNSNMPAEEWLKQSAVNGNPDSMIKWAHFAAFEVSTSNKDLELARKLLTVGKEDRSKSVEWYQASAELYRRENNLKKANSELKKANKMAKKLGWNSISLNTET